jgi:hypothetical protein
MEIERILLARDSRKARSGAPYKVFDVSISECIEAGKFVLDTSTSKHVKLLERSMVITTVSAIEAYYKDVLDGIFRVCSPDFFEPILRYDISDLVEMHRKRVHPLELIAANQSFQNAEVIDAVFSKFLGKSFGTRCLLCKYGLRTNRRLKPVLSPNY